MIHEGGDSEKGEDEAAETIKSRKTKKKASKKKGALSRKNSFAAETEGNDGTDPA
jgi:hypothetical protein